MAVQETVRSAWQVAYSAQVAVIPPRPAPRYVRRMTILGPDNSKFGLYSGLVPVDLYLLSTTNVGLRNSSIHNPPLVIPANTNCVGAWTGGSTAAGTIAQLTIEWEPGGL